MRANSSVHQARKDVHIYRISVRSPLTLDSQYTSESWLLSARLGNAIWRFAGGPMVARHCMLAWLAHWKVRKNITVLYNFFYIF